MEYAIDAKDFGDRGLAVITTKWVHFGAGLKVPDLKWRSHGDPYIDRRKVGQTADHLGEIRAGFENKAELSLEDLTADNERMSFSTRKSHSVAPAPDGCI